MMNIELIKECLRAMDLTLTGVSINKTKLTQGSQLDRIDAMQEGDDLEYYLSDGGYSRIWVDPLERRVFLTDNSTLKVKERWNLVSDLALELQSALGQL